MKPMKKKILSILLAAVMVLSLIPAIALSVSADPVPASFASAETFFYKSTLSEGVLTGLDEEVSLRANNPVSKLWDSGYGSGMRTEGLVGYTPSIYFDEDTHEFAQATATETTRGVYLGYVKIALTDESTLTSFSVYSSMDDSDFTSGFTLNAFDIYYSADGTHWTFAKAFTGMSGTDASALTAAGKWVAAGTTGTTKDKARYAATTTFDSVTATHIAIAVKEGITNAKQQGDAYIEEIGVVGNLNELPPDLVEVATESELRTAVSSYRNSETTTIRLTADITMASDAGTLGGIGCTLDGGNHTIYNCRRDYFCYPLHNGTIENLIFSNKTAPDGSTFTINGQKSLFGDPAASEILAGEVATIRNVVNYRNLDNTGSNSNKDTGGFFNSVNIAGTIRIINCTNHGAYTGDSSQNPFIGGFIGCMNGGTVEFVGCTNTADVKASQAGGFIGAYKGGTTITMENCTNSGAITGYNSSKGYGIAGGIIGSFGNAGNIDGNVAVTLTGCLNTGNISVQIDGGTKTNAIGGLIGHAGVSVKIKSDDPEKVENENPNLYSSTITLNNCGVYDCTINTNGAAEYAAPLVGKCSPRTSETFTVTANSCYVSQVNVIGGTARKLIGVGASTAGAVNAYNCVLNEVTENGSEEWNGSKYSNLNVAVSSTNFFTQTAATAISDGLAPAYQLASAEADTTKVRFLATLKDGALTAYDKVGFFVTASYDTTVKGWNLNSTTVYSSVIAAGVSTNASAIYDGHGSEAYIFVATLEGINIPPQDVTFNVTPYVVNADGSILFGLTGQFEILVGSL